jgi:hypothetical protein
MTEKAHLMMFSCRYKFGGLDEQETKLGVPIQLWLAVIATVTTLVVSRFH